MERCFSARFQDAVAEVRRQSPNPHGPAGSQTPIFSRYQWRKMHRDHAIDDILEALSGLDHSPSNPPGGKPVRLKSTARVSLAA
jgi:hypothetical protein